MLQKQTKQLEFRFEDDFLAAGAVALCGYGVCYCSQVAKHMFSLVSFMTGRTQVSAIQSCFQDQQFKMLKE